MILPSLPSIQNSEADEGLALADEPTGASNPRGNDGLYVEHVRVSDGDPASYESLRQTINEKTRRGWKLISMVKDPAGRSVELVWEVGDSGNPDPQSGRDS